MIGSSSITLSKFKKVRKGRLSIPKTILSTELEIRALYVSPEFANSVNSSGLHISFHRAFALRPTVMLFFGLVGKQNLFTRILSSLQ